MPRSLPRTQWIAQWLQSHAQPAPLTEPDLRRLQAECTQQFPDLSHPTLEQLADLVHDAGGQVRYGDLSGSEEDHILQLSSLPALEAGLRELQQRLASARHSLDREAVERARRAARRMRRRALRVVANPNASHPRRAEKQEMADWLLLWLEMPEAFFEWLSVRKRTPDFQSLLPPPPDDSDAGFLD